MNGKRVLNRCNFICVAVIALAMDVVASVASAQSQSGNWIRLIEGNDFSAWRVPTGDWKIVGDVFVNPTSESLLAWNPGTGVIVNGAKGRTNNLLAKMEHGDIEAHIEFMIPKGSNSGVYFMGRYEIQVYDSFGVKQPKYNDCGGIYERWKDNKGYEGHGPRVNAARKPGEWQTFDVIFRAPRFDADGKKIANAVFVKVVHNGTVIHEKVEVTGPTRAAAFNDEKPTGPLMVQGDHGPVAYANIRIRPLQANLSTDDIYKRILKYEFGDDREDLIFVEEAIRAATPDQCKEIETRLIGILKSPDAANAAKDAACRMLRQIGTAQSVPALAELLTDEKLSHMARYAMQGMACPEVDAAFRGALGKVSGKIKIGLIGSIGARANRKAVPELSKLITDKDTTIARAAVIALGQIGGAEAAKALAGARVPDALQSCRADAYLMCADKMFAEGETSDAAAIYREMLGEGNAAAVRIAALRGIARAKDKTALPEVAKAAESENEGVRAAAIRALEILRNP